jgi:hypothetical protein
MRALLDEIFQRKKRRRPLALAGGVFFIGLGLVSLIDAIRASPLEVGGGVALYGAEAAFYRIAAFLICAALGAWLIAGARPPEENDRLLR